MIPNLMRTRGTRGEESKIRSDAGRAIRTAMGTVREEKRKKNRRRTKLCKRSGACEIKDTVAQKIKKKAEGGGERGGEGGTHRRKWHTVCA